MHSCYHRFSINQIKIIDIQQGTVCQVQQKGIKPQVGFWAPNLIHPIKSYALCIRVKWQNRSTTYRQHTMAWCKTAAMEILQCRTKPSIYSFKYSSNTFWHIVSPITLVWILINYATCNHCYFYMIFKIIITQGKIHNIFLSCFTNTASDTP